LYHLFCLFIRAKAISIFHFPPLILRDVEYPKPLKVDNRTNFLVFRWCATHHWKAFNKGYNFVSDLIIIEGLHTKLWGPKVTGVLTLAISGLPFGSSRTKCHSDVGLMERHKVYYKGKGDGFPQVRAMVSLMSPNLPMTHLSTKSAPTMH